MWSLIILFIPIVILMVVLYEYLKNIKKKEKNEEFEEIKDNSQNEFNILMQEIEEKEKKQSSYYDDNVSDEEVEETINNIKSDNLTTNQIIFLKFMNNKDTDITFSPRWEFVYELKPRIELAKLLKLEYLTYSSLEDNVKSSTMKQLKEILKEENLKVSGNKQELVERVLGNVNADLLEEKFKEGKYKLTDKGNKIIEKNKRLFMSDKEKAGKEFEELTNNEYNQLKVFHKLNKYKELKYNELSFEKGYKKNDILWSIFNEQALEYLNKKDYTMASVVYDNMYSLLYSEKKYQKALDFLICCLYMRVYEMLPSNGIICDTDCYERHLNKYMKELRNVLDKNDMNIEKFDNRYKFITEYIKVPIQMYLPHWYEFEKVNKFQQKINEFFDV